MRKQKTNSFLLLLIAVFTVVACIKLPVSNTPPSVLSPTEVSTNSNNPESAQPQQIQIEPTSTLDPTMVALYILPRPTMEAALLKRLIELLHSDACSLPCYLGITPGQTTWKEAQVILESLGAFFSFDTVSQGLTVHNVQLDIGDETLAVVTPETKLSATNVKIVQSLHFIVVDGVVEKMWTSVSTRKFVSRFRDYWSRYSLRELLLQYGAPDQIMMPIPAPGGIGVSYILIYKENGIVATLWDQIQDNSVCPALEKNSADFSLTLTNTSSGLDIYAPGVVAPTNREIYLPIEEMLSASTQLFYEQVVKDPSICFHIQYSN